MEALVFCEVKIEEMITGMSLGRSGGGSMLELYAHNQSAYAAAVNLMRQAGKAAIIHPTGTGKSIIAFKLIEDHPDRKVCWLSPSKYILETQRENVRRLDPNFDDENVIYLTYARLMNMDSEELRSLGPDYIILDEFHRCGAAEWGRGVSALLAQYPDVPVMGLSATSIRYLDRQRDMAAELFDGNIASEMSVAEAIATGILPAPTYVIALFSYQKELEKYERRVNSVRHRNRFDENLRYLEALRRALEMSVGLDQVFRKHITNKSGKYIVFCSSREHMDSVQEQIPEWFSGVDREPRVYRVYSDDPGSEQAFLDFKQDVSGHLKLLLCIDMLSEGIHVDDISGVILLRPTTSPIVYKQQIGRALAAGKRGTPLIIDVVNNFDNLVSISWLQEEVQTAADCYRQKGMGDRIVEETFSVIDEVRECRALLDQLEKSLSASWEVNYQAAKQYFESNGDLNVPVAYRTDSGIQLGVWISTQRRLFHGNYHGSLTQDRIDKLNRIGMIWVNRYESYWECLYQIAEDYYIENGHLKVPVQYVTEDGIQLGRWVHRQMNNRQALSEEKIKRLDTIGMVWINSWDARYDMALDYLLENPGYQLSQSTVIGDFWVGKWLVQQLRGLEKGVLSPEKAEKMHSLMAQTGISSKTQSQQKWEAKFECARALTEKYGLYRNWPEGKETKESLRWIKGQLKKLEAGQLRYNEVEMLKSIGVVPENKEDPWMRNFRLAEEYHTLHGNLDVPASYVTEEGARLGTWVCRQRSIYNGSAPGKSLTAQQVQLLEGIGMEWNPRRKAFETGLQAAQRYYRENGNLNVPTKYVDDLGFPLFQWLADIRKKKSKLPHEDIRYLESMQFVWEKRAGNGRA